MENILRVSLISNIVYPANPKKSVDNIKECVNKLNINYTYNPVDIVVLSLGGLIGNSCGKLLYNNGLLKEMEIAVNELMDISKKYYDTLFVFGNVEFNQKELNLSPFVLLHGEKIEIDENNNIDYLGIKIKVASFFGDNLLPLYYNGEIEGCELIILPSSIPSKVLKYKNIINKIKMLSEECCVSTLLVNTGNFDTQTPYLFGNLTIATENGNILIENISYEEPLINTVDNDIDIIRGEKIAHNKKINNYFSRIKNKNTFLRNININPYVDKKEAEEFYKELFLLSAVSLSRRLKLTNINKIIIGVSGGLDSTLALLTCVKAMEILSLPTENIIAVTMPGFGTTKKTKNNGYILMEKLGVTIKEIPITKSVEIHLENIQHDKKDVVFENAQARQRTHILLDLSNKYGGIVVGTGDLSEEALGFSTFGGDHLSQFNVNVCITKSMIKNIINILLTDEFNYVSNVLQDILNTPISPELLPPDELDNITQKTEEILGPYILHDFFLYYHVKYNMDPNKILQYSKIAFDNSEFKDEFTNEYLKNKLNLFLKRFYLNQYKRSCAPDSAVLTDVNLSNKEYYIPSDVVLKGI